MAYIRRDIESKVTALSTEYACILVTGPRQVGKTTMLRKLMGESRHYVTLDDLEARRLAKSDPALFLQMHDIPILIDEVQYVNSRDMSALLVALHKVSQAGLPVMFVGAGLPNVARLTGFAKSCSERLLEWRQVGALPPEACRQAIRKPLEQGNASIADEALDLIVKGTCGYPFFVQTWAYYAWDEASTNTITVTDVEKAYRITVDTLDNGFFWIRFSRLTEKDFEYVRAMATLGTGPYPVGRVSKAMGKSTAVAAKQRDSLIKKGLIYSPKFGFVDFSVPLFSDFLVRLEKLR